jgi:hypothetical protein
LDLGLFELNCATEEPARLRFDEHLKGVEIDRYRPIKIERVVDIRRYAFGYSGKDKNRFLNLHACAHLVALLDEALFDTFNGKLLNLNGINIPHRTRTRARMGIAVVDSTATGATFAVIKIRIVHDILL